MYHLLWELSYDSLAWSAMSNYRFLPWFPIAERRVLWGSVTPTLVDVFAHLQYLHAYSLFCSYVPAKIAWLINPDSCCDCLHRVVPKWFNRLVFGPRWCVVPALKLQPGLSLKAQDPWKMHLVCGLPSAGAIAAGIVDEDTTSYWGEPSLFEWCRKCIIYPLWKYALADWTSMCLQFVPAIALTVPKTIFTA